MRRHFASICDSSIISAAALSLLVVPLAAKAATPEPPKPLSAPAIEVHEGRPGDHGPCAQPEGACAHDANLTKDRAYLVETAHPGDTMRRQGPEVAIGRLNPEFATRLAGAIREAREAGLAEAGIFSAYRPPAFGVGGFSDKFNSLHAYGLAVDMQGIGRPGSSQAKLWHSIAAKHGVVCPYGVNNRAEWNHCQPTRIKVIRADNPLRKTIAAVGPVSPFGMFEAGNALIESVANLSSWFTGVVANTLRDGRAAVRESRNRRVRSVDAGAAKQHRHVQSTRRKVRGSKVAARTTARKAKDATVRRAMARRAQRVSSSQVN